MASSNNTSFRMALIEEIQNVEDNIENIRYRIFKNETYLQNLINTNMGLEDFLENPSAFNKKRSIKKIYQRRIFYDKEYLEKEIEKLEKLERDFKEYEKERWARLLPKTIYQRIFLNE